MKTTIKKLSDVKVSVEIVLGKQELDDAEQVALVKLSKKVKVPGFRQGKAPIAAVKKHIDPTALAEQTLDDALSKAVSKAFTDEKIQALDRPQVELKKYVPGQELEFTAEAEVMPEVKLGNYKKLGVKRAVEKLDAKEIDDVVERMRKNFAERKDADRAAKDGDEVVIDFEGKRDGVAFDGGKAKDYTLALGSKQFIPGFEEQIVGHKAGEEFDIDVEFPKDYHTDTLAGQKVVFSIKLSAVKELSVPELDDKLAAKVGPFKTVKELKDDIKRELTAGKDREADDKFKDALIDKLVEVSTVPVPEILVEDQTRSIEQDMTQNLMYQGLTIDQYLANKKLTHEEWLKGEVRDAAVRRVKAGLVLAEVSKVEKITATDEELAEKIKQFQQQYGPQSGQDFTTPEIQRDIANRLLTEKSIDRLVELN